MTPEERKVLDALADAWNLLCALPVYHPSDVAEAAPHIHALQAIVMARAAVRAEPEYFRTVGPEAPGPKRLRQLFELRDRGLTPKERRELDDLIDRWERSLEQPEPAPSADEDVPAAISIMLSEYAAETDSAERYRISKRILQAVRQAQQPEPVPRPRKSMDAGRTWVPMTDEEIAAYRTEPAPPPEPKRHEHLWHADIEDEDHVVRCLSCGVRQTPEPAPPPLAPGDRVWVECDVVGIQNDDVAVTFAGIEGAATPITWVPAARVHRQP